MALVAYGNSDSSDYEDEVDEIAPVVISNNISKSKHESPVANLTANTANLEESTEIGPSLFNFLPQPTRKKPAVIEEDDEFLHKKESTNAIKPKARITVPSLSDFKDVKDIQPIVKPRVPTDKKSSLLSMLPQPRNGVRATTKSLIPHVLTKKPEAKTAPMPTPMKKPRVEPTPVINDYSDESDNEEVQNDFFSIHKPVDIPDDVELPLDIEQNTKKLADKPKGIDAFFKKDEDIEHVQLEPDYDDQILEEQAEASSSYNGYGADSSNSNDAELDEEAIMKLCGSRGKRKREEIQIVNVNQAEVLANAREMLMKGLLDDTTKRVSASKKKGNEPTTQQRRKHQITYLAFQAKANEAELQNQWANNRMSKRQTQAKYGF